MSLRTAYTGSLSSALVAARTAGRLFIVDPTNLTALQNAMVIAANSGKTQFTYNHGVTYQPADLRLLGALWEAYQTGVLQGLAEQDIMFNEVEVNLNTSDQQQTSIDLVFSF
jgi:hypothetical protein